MATVHAFGIIALSCIAGFYYLNQSITDATANIPISNGTVPSAAPPSGTTALVSANASVDQESTYQNSLRHIRESLAARKVADAERLITQAKLNPNSDQQLITLEINAGNLKAYLRAVDEAESALVSKDTRELSEKLSIASSFGFSDQRLEALKLNLQNSLQRESIEAANARLARKGFNLHLASAEHYFNLGNISLALSEIEMARSFGIKDRKLDELGQQIESASLFRSAPLTEADLVFAAGRFSQLEQAIKHKNSRAIESLTTGNPEHNALFHGLFDRYVELTTSISDIRNIEDGKIVHSTLALENMRLPNGNITYPSSSYGTINLSIELTREGWSKIKW